MFSLSIKNLENVIGAERQEPENSERTNLRANLPLLSPLWITCYLLLVTCHPKPCVISGRRSLGREAPPPSTYPHNLPHNLPGARQSYSEPHLLGSSFGKTEAGELYGTLARDGLPLCWYFGLIGYSRALI